MQHKLLVGAALALAMMPARADDLTNTIANAIKDGTVNLSFRYRYEFVDDDAFEKDADANTLKSRLTFTPQFDEAWSAVIEVDNVSHIGSARFNDTRNGNIEYPVVADPKGTDLNQALIKYTGFTDTVLIGGRQRIDRGNQRFVGGVAWRQNEQTYDSVTGAYGEGKPLQLYYAYIYQVNRVFGPEDGIPTRKFDSGSNLFEIHYKFSELFRVEGYAYLLDLENGDNFSNASYGARAAGEVTITEDTRVRYVVEAAKQTDYGDNPVNYDTHYYQFEAGLDWKKFGAVIGYEVLGGDSTPGGGFRTPLATLFKFQGWADRFATATAAGIDDGIRDARIGLSTQFAGARWELYYHDFSADRGGLNWGSEVDASASWSFYDHYGVSIIFAKYDDEDFDAGDLTKAWLQLTASF